MFEGSVLTNFLQFRLPPLPPWCQISGPRSHLQLYLPFWLPSRTIVTHRPSLQLIWPRYIMMLSTGLNHATDIGITIDQGQVMLGNRLEDLGRWLSQRSWREADSAMTLSHVREIDDQDCQAVPPIEIIEFFMHIFCTLVLWFVWYVCLCSTCLLELYHWLAQLRIVVVSKFIHWSEISCCR